MRELIDDLERWRAAGNQIAVARVVEVVGSGPRAPGAAMAVNATGEIAGSVSGGCVEGAVVEAAQEVLATGGSSLHTFGYSDADAFAVGLSCGGTVTVFVEPLSWQPKLYDALLAALRSGTAAALATVVSGPHAGAKLLHRPDAEPVGSLGDAALDAVVHRDAQGQVAAGVTSIRRYGPHGEARRDDVAVFIESFVPAPQLVAIGAVDFTGALVRIARELGFRTRVCDARPAFATPARFPGADEVVVDWPQRYLATIGPQLTPRDAVCVMTHDAKFDVPAIVAALQTEVGYLGVMGSRRTHRDRLAELRAAGVDAAGLARLHSPVGLDIGARTPEETAISICAEIIAVRTGRDLIRPLTHTTGPIHRDADNAEIANEVRQLLRG